MLGGHTDKQQAEVWSGHCEGQAWGLWTGARGLCRSEDRCACLRGQPRGPQCPAACCMVHMS